MRVFTVLISLAFGGVFGPNPIARGQSPVPSSSIITIAGNGSAGYSGDGGPATNAEFYLPGGSAVGRDGALYLSDDGNNRIRRIAPLNGIITTFAGNGVNGDTGDGGPATNATFGGVLNVVVDRARNILYVPDAGNNRVRQVNLTNGIITNFAGQGLSGFGFGGDGGPAAAAEFAFIQGIGIDYTGNVSITDYNNYRVRRVDIATTNISTLAGTGDLFSAPNCAHLGDGGPATSAYLGDPGRVVADAAGNVFVLDYGGDCNGRNRVRRVDAVTGIITTVVGGGTNALGDGAATNMSLVAPGDIAVNAEGTTLFVSAVPGYPTPGAGDQIFKLDVATGQLSLFAGNGTNGFGFAIGDGGPAVNAEFSGVSALTALPGGGLLVSDLVRLRYIAPASITLTNDSQQTAFYLPWVGAMAGDLIIANNSNLDVINIGALVTVTGSISIDSNASATVISVDSLTNVTGSISVNHNTSAGVIDIDSLVTSSGSVTINSNTSAAVIDIGSLTSTGGNLDVSDNSSAGVIDINSLVTSSGSVTINSNTSAAVIDIGSLTSTGGNLDVSDNSSAGVIDINSLVTSSGSVTINSNTSAAVIDIGSLTSTGGNLDVSDNSSAGVIDINSLVTSSGSVTINSNASAAVINIGSLTSTGGNLNISGNNTATNVHLGSLTNVCGDLTVTSNAPNANVNLNSLTNYGCGTNALTMTVDGNVSVTNGLTVNTNATLAGSANVDGSVTNNGTISPGSSPGHMAFSGHLGLGNSSRLRMEIAGYTPGAELDIINVAGSVTLGGTLSVSLIRDFVSVMTNGASFTLLTAGSPLTGAFANVADGGILTTTDGYARFTVRYAGANTLRLTGLVIVDTDNDGMPDWWEDRYGLNKNNSSDSTLDADGDGVSNLNEFLAGTNPTNPASFFHITSVHPEAGDMRLTWTTVGGKSYVVQTNTTTAGGGFTANFSDFSPLMTAPGTGESTTNIVDTVAVTNAPARYYRVRLGP